MEIIAYKYSEILTKGDIIDLFKMLEENKTLSEICRKIGIDRKTVYNWKKVKEIKRNTKIKILAEALKTKPKETLEFIADKSIERTTEILSELFTILYEQAMKAENPKEFIKVYEEFRRTLTKYNNPPLKEIASEISELLYRLNRKAQKYNILSSPIVFTLEEKSVLGIELTRVEHRAKEFSYTTTYESKEDYLLTATT